MTYFVIISIRSFLVYVADLQDIPNCLYYSGSIERFDGRWIIFRKCSDNFQLCIQKRIGNNFMFASNALYIILNSSV